MFRPFEKTSESLIAGEFSAPPSPEFSLEERRTLLHIAHSAIRSALDRPAHDHPTLDHQRFSEAPPPGLSEPRGIFTTLYLGGQLRGCVGYAMPVAPLYRAVAETACAAAFDDSRFVPVTKEEAPSLQIALSVLSRLFAIRPECVEVGRHGLVISRGARRGLLLPQVPVENGWDRDTFLQQTCRKAGLPLDAWQTGATIEAFTAEVFADGDLKISEQ
ncbi:MAG TPA: AmmeMemoRadiSam system protein A [Terriglobales bacterium]|nr:AmmeMemoRadiSam system protein A [Terriglobales bacterium]